MTGREIRRALRAGDRVYASALTTPSRHWPAAARKAGLDFVFLDTEHIPLGRELLSWMCQAYAAVDLPAVVRIPSPDPYEAAKVLDGGACGVIGPYVETADQVRALAGATRWRPLKGERLREALRDPGTLEPELRAYVEARNEDTILIANIESVPAIRDLDALLAVPGLDAVLIGPHDLSCSLGVPEQYRHPRFDEAVRTIFGKARAHGVGAGIHYWEGVGEEVAWARAGGNLIMHASDLALVGQHLTRDLDALRSALGDARPAAGSGG